MKTAAGAALWGLTSMLVVFSTTPVWAQGEDEALAEAKQHVERGKNAYKRGEYETAISEYEAANRLRPSPVLSYNIGLALERLGDCGKAIDHFERYLREQPNAENAKETQEKIAAQKQLQARNACVEWTPGQPAPTPRPTPSRPTPSHPPVIERGNPPSPTTAASQEATLPAVQPGLSPRGVSLRFGTLVGGLGDVSYERSAGLLLRAGYLFPLARLSDGRVVLHGETYLGFAYFGFDAFDVQINNPVTGGQLLGTNGSGSAKALLAGFGIRANFYPAPTLPLAITPGISVGLAPQFFSQSFQNLVGGGICSESSTVLAPYVDVELGLRYELSRHHAFTFSPANLYVTFPGVNDGSAPFGCLGDTRGAKEVYRLGETALHYGIDVGYLYQF